MDNDAQRMSEIQDRLLQFMDSELHTDEDHMRPHTKQPSVSLSNVGCQSHIATTSQKPNPVVLFYFAVIPQSIEA